MKICYYDYLCIDTAVTEFPGTAVYFTHRAHDGSVSLTDLFTEDTKKTYSLN